MAGTQGTLDAAGIPFAVRTANGAGKLALVEQDLFGWLHVDRLELDVPGGPEVGAPASRYQRRRTQVRIASLRLDQPAIDARAAAAASLLAAHGITGLAARATDGAIAVSARVADGLAAADVSFRIVLTSAGLAVRALAGALRVHGHLPTPGPLIAHRVIEALIAAPGGAAASGATVRGLCDLEFDALGAFLWRLLPPAGWRLPSAAGIELSAVRVGRGAIHLTYAPAVQRAAARGLDPATQLAAAHDAMRSADELLRRGQIDEAMRGYRALVASAPADHQPILLERILAIGAARPAWFLDAIELARQALARWPAFAPARAALASIAIAKGDPRDGALHLQALAQLAAAEGDDDGAALAALAAARLVRVLDPIAATALYQQVLDHRPGHGEAQAALAERFADEQRWPELVRLLRARAQATVDRARAARDHVRIAEVLALQLRDRPGARAELERARGLDPDEPVVHETLAIVAAEDGDHAGAIAAWTAVADLATARRDQPAIARALARRARSLEDAGHVTEADADWQRAIAADPGAAEALRGAAQAAARRGDHHAAAALWQRLASSGVAAAEVARAQLEHGRALVDAGELAAARAPLYAATAGRGEVAADAHALLAELRLPDEGSLAAADSLDAAIEAWVAAADEVFAVDPADGERMLSRAAQLAVERARLLDHDGDARAVAGWRRAHELAASRAPAAARDAARALLVTDPADEPRWLDALLATAPPALEQAALLIRRAAMRTDAAPSAALVDLTDALTALDHGDDHGADHAAARAMRRDALAIAARAHAAIGDTRARAVALAAHAALVDDDDARATAEADAAEAWLAADEAAAALPHGERAAAQLALGSAAPPLRRRVLELLGEAAWRQRAWADVAAAYRPLLDDPPSLATPVFTYRLAIAADKLGDTVAATAALERLGAMPDAPGELVGHARRVLADLYERADRPAEAAAALEALAEDPGIRDATDATRAEAYYRAAELHRRRGATEDAVRCLEGALRTVEDHLPALDALELLVRDLGDLERVAVILGRKIAATQRQPARQKALLTRLAQLQLQLGRPEVAVASARRALEIDPGYRPALRVIADDAIERSDSATAARAYLALLAEGGDDLPVPERRLAVDALAALIERHPDAPWHAAAVAMVARHQPPVIARTSTDRAFPPFTTTTGPIPVIDDPGSRRALADAALGRGDAAAAADHLDALARALIGARRAEVLLELADLAYDRLGDRRRARAAMRAAADAHGPGVRGDATLRVLAAEAAAGADHDDAAAALTAIPPERRTAVDVVALAHAEQRRGRDAAAIAALERARADQRLSDEGAMLLFALHQELRRKAELAASLERRTRAAIAADAAGVRAMGLSTSEARARLGEALSLYRDALADGAGAARIEALLAQLPPELAAVIAPPDADVAPAGRDTAAIAAVAAVAAVSPDDDIDDDSDGGETAVFDRPLEIAPVATAPEGAPAEAAPAEAAPAEAAPPASTDAAPAPEPLAGRQPRELERLAAAAADVGDHASAAEMYAGALEARAAAGEADLGDAQRRLREAAERAGAPRLLVRGLLAAAQVTPIAGPGGDGGGRAAALYREAASVSRSALDDDPGAINALGRAHLLLPADPTIGAELTELLRRVGDTARLAEVLERTARSASGTVRARALYELGVLHRDHWGDVLRSTEMLAAAHRADPELVAVWLPLADALVAGDDLPGARGLYERTLARADLAPNVRAFVEDRLAVLDHDDAVVSGEVRGRAATGDRAEDARPSVEITAVVVDDGDGELLTAEATPTAPRDAAPDADGAAPLDERVTAPMAAQAPSFDDADRPPHARTTEPLAIAVLPYATPVDAAPAAPIDVDAAPAAPIDVDAAPPADAVPRHLPALDETGRAALGAALGTTLRGVFGEWRPPAVSPTASHDPERQLARALDLTAAGRLDAAIAHAEAATAPPATDDQRQRALALLEDLYAKLGDSDAVTEVIGRQIVATPAAGARAQHWRRRAALYRDVLHREAETYRCLREAHACAPDDADIAYELRAVAMARGEWALTAELLYREIAAAPSPRDKGALHLELGMVFDEKLLDPDQARRNFEQALAHDPSIPAARRPLAHLYELAGRHGDAARWYERAAEVARPSERAHLLERAALATARAGLRGAPSSLPPPTSPTPLVDDDPVGDLARRLAAALALDDLATAVALARDINERDPRHPIAFRVLDERAQADRDLDALAALYERRAEADPSERGHLYFSLGRTTEAAGAPDVAARWFDRALAVDPDQPGALDARAALAMRVGDWATADALYAQLPPSRATLSAEALLMRRAELAELLGRDGDALAKARAAAALQPPRKDAWALVMRLAEKVGDVATALAAARAQLELIPPGDLAAVTAVRAAAAALCRAAGDRAAAIAWLEQIIGDEPQHDAALAELATLYAATGNPIAANRALRARLGLADTTAKKAALHLQIGELALAQGELPAADDAFLRASDLDPAHAPTLRRLLDVYWRADDPDALGEVATELALADALTDHATPAASLARAAIAAAASGALRLAGTIASHLGPDAATAFAGALAELVDRPATAHLTLDGAIIGLRDLAARSTGPALAELAHAAAVLGEPGAPVVAALG